MRYQLLYFLALVHSFSLGPGKVRQVDVDEELSTLKMLSHYNDLLALAQRMLKNLGYAARVVQINDDSTITEFAIDSNSAVYKYGDLISWNNKSVVYVPPESPAKREWEMAFSFEQPSKGVLVSVNSFLEAVVNQVVARDFNVTMEFTHGAFLSLKNVHGTQAPDFDCYKQLVKDDRRCCGLKVKKGVGCHILRSSDDSSYFTVALGTDSYAVTQARCKRFAINAVTTASKVCN